MNWRADAAQVVVGNFNHDEFDDIAIIPNDGSELAISYGDSIEPLERFEVVSSSVLPVFMHQAPVVDAVEDGYIYPEALQTYAVGDFTGDDLSDIIVSRAEQGMYDIYVFDESTKQFILKQTFTSAQALETGGSAEHSGHHLYVGDFNNDGSDDLFAQSLLPGQRHYYMFSDVSGGSDSNVVFNVTSAKVLPATFTGFEWNANEHTTNLIDIDLDGSPELVRMSNSVYIQDLEGRLVVDGEADMSADSACRLLIYSVGASSHQRGCRTQANYHKMVAAAQTNETSYNSSDFIDLSAHPILGLSNSAGSASKSAQGSTQIHPGAPSSMSKLRSDVGTYPRAGTRTYVRWDTSTGAIIYQLQERKYGQNWVLTRHRPEHYSYESFPTASNYLFRARACNVASGSQTCNAWSHTFLMYAYDRPSKPTSIIMSSNSIQIGQTLRISWTRAGGIIGTGGYYEFEELPDYASYYAYHSETATGNYITHNITPNKGVGEYRYRFRACNKSSSLCGGWAYFTVDVTRQLVNYPASGEVELEGAPQVGATLTSSHTITDGNGMGNLRYQWLRDDADIAGQTGTSYLVTSADLGKQLSVEIAFNDGDGFSEQIVSDKTAPVVAEGEPVPGAYSMEKTFVYDALGRLVTVKKDGEQIRKYKLDKAGNRTSIEGEK